MAQIEIGKLIYNITSRLDGKFSANLTKAEQSAVKVGTAMGKATEKAKGMAGSMFSIQNAMKAFVAGALVKGTAELIKQGAELNSLTQSFNRMSADIGVASEDILNILKKQSAGTVSNKDLVLSANRAMALGVATSTEEFGQLMDIARLKASEMGITVTQAFNDIVTGVGRGSPLILDNLGIVVKATESQENYAKSLGKTVEELTETEKKEALKFAVLKSGNEAVAKAGVLTLTYADRLAKLRASTDNVKTGIGSALLPAVNNLLVAFQKGGKESDTGSTKFDTFGRVMYRVSNVVIVLGATVSNLANAVKIAWNGIQTVFNGGALVVLSAMQLIMRGLGQDTATIDSALTGLAENSKKNFDDVGDAIANMKENSDTIKTAMEQAFNPTNYEAIVSTSNAVDELGASLEDETLATTASAEEAKKAKDEMEAWTKSLLSARDGARKTAETLNGELGKSFEKFAGGIKDSFEETNSGLADVVLETEARKKELEELLKENKDASGANRRDDTQDSEQRREREKELKAEKEKLEKQLADAELVFDAQKGFEERRVEKITAIRAQLEEAGIDASKAGLDALETTATLEEQLDEKRRIAGLDAFTRFEEEAFKKLEIIVANFIQENALIQGKIDAQKGFEADLTEFLGTELTNRQSDIDAFASVAIAKYGEVANSIESLLSQQARLAELPNLLGGAEQTPGKGQLALPNGYLDSISKISSQLQPASSNNTTNISPTVNIAGGGVDKSLSATELSAILGFELNKFMR